MSKKSIIKGKTKAKFAAPLAAMAIMGSTFGLAGYASAATTTSSSVSQLFPVTSRAKHLPGIIGTVSEVNGSSISVVGKNNTTYTVDAESAKIVKDKNTQITVSDVKVGDTVLVKGTVNGTTVTADVVRDGKIPAGFRKGRHPRMGIRGTVSNVSGNTITIAGKDNITYTVDASNAKILKSKTDIVTVSDINSGDTLFVRGSINGTDITAKAIFDGVPLANKNKAN